MLQAIYAAAGFQGILVSLNGHDALAVYLPSLAKWVYQDASFNERLNIGPLEAASPAELLAASQDPATFVQITSVTGSGPQWDPAPYADHLDLTYFITSRPPLMTYLRSHLQGNLLGGVTVMKTVLVAGSTNDPAAALYPEAAVDVAFPTP